MIIEVIPVNKILPVLSQNVNLVLGILNDNKTENNYSTLQYALLKEKARLITITDAQKIIAIVIIQPVKYATGYKVLFIPGIQGEGLEDWLPELMEVLIEQAKHFGCTEIRSMVGRKGWVRALKNLGWTHIYEVISYKVKK